MLKLEKVRKQVGMNAVMDINVGDISDLPHLNDVVCGLHIMSTSIAVDKSGTWYKLHDTDEWYVQDGSGNTTSDLT